MPFMPSQQLWLFYVMSCLLSGSSWPGLSQLACSMHLTHSTQVETQANTVPPKHSTVLGLRGKQAKLNTSTWSALMNPRRGLTFNDSLDLKEKVFKSFTWDNETRSYTGGLRDVLVWLWDENKYCAAEATHLPLPWGLNKSVSVTCVFRGKFNTLLLCLHKWTMYKRLNLSCVQNKNFKALFSHVELYKYSSIH